MRALLAALILLTAAPVAQARSWIVDPGASRLEVGFTQGSGAVIARFERFDARIAFDPDALDRSSVEVTVELASFASGDATRDGQAVSAEFLDVATSPVATYRATGFRALGGDRYAVDGELTLRGVTRPLAHEATITIDGDSARASGTVPVLRTDFGVGARQFATGDTVGLEVVVTFEIRARAG
jgi:polyisoprenoid-binding protein YceI